MQSQRLRMVSDSELRLEQFQAERKDEKRRYEDALDRLKQVGCTAHHAHAMSPSESHRRDVTESDSAAHGKQPPPRPMQLCMHSCNQASHCYIYM